MKLAFMTFACPDWGFEQVLAAAERHGYQGVEFRCDASHLHGVEVAAGGDERQRMRRQLGDAGIAACCLATSLRFFYREAIEEAAARVELATEMGVPALRVFCGEPPAGTTHEEMLAACVEHLRETADAASQHGVELWLETHDAICRGADAAAIVRKVGHPAVGVNYDNMHPYRVGESLEETVAQLGNLVRHTHFHDSLNRHDQVVIRPLGQGELPMDEMFQALLNMGYDGFLSGEWFGHQYGADPDDALDLYHRDMTTLAERHGVRLG